MADVRLQPADYAWLATFVGWLIFEFTSQDLLTDSAERMVIRHPILTRLGIFAIAGHLAVVLPHHIDLLNAKNGFHRRVAHEYRRAEAKVFARQVIRCNA